MDWTKDKEKLKALNEEERWLNRTESCLCVLEQNCSEAMQKALKRLMREFYTCQRINRNSMQKLLAKEYDNEHE